MASSKRYRLFSAAMAMTLCMSLQSCFTAGLWNSDMKSREKAWLTPVAVTLDVVTLPLQLAVVDSLGDHHHHHSAHSHRRAHRHCR